ncbi:MAG: DUF4296 domain-containing protein [Chitinophagaceae bacterium]|nr:DUF4296 domain-containing protein [Chitinophagaceae bacterium]
MNGKTIVFICLVAILGSCKGDNAPKDILGKEEMKSVLWDVLQAQAWAQEKARQDSSVTLASATRLLTEEVFKVHKISGEIFEKSYDWYRKHPELLGPMLDSLYSQNSELPVAPSILDNTMEQQQDGPARLRRPK